VMYKLIIGYWLFVFGYWLLVIGYWLLVIGYWLLVIGYWLLVGELLTKLENRDGTKPDNENQKIKYV
jgi:hypothetical protein